MTTKGDGCVITPTIAPIKHVVSVPDAIDFSTSALISSRRSGAITPRPPKLAKPHGYCGHVINAPDLRNRAVTNRMVSAAPQGGR
jgi:hypothetical protein